MEHTATDVASPARPPGAHFTQAPGRSNRAARWLKGPGDGAPALVLTTAIVTLLTWRNVPWRVAVGGIDSWQTALALAFQRHIQWGPHAIFTFGPYGFVEDIMPYGRVTAAIAVIYTLVVYAGVISLVLARLRGTWGLVPAAVIAWFVVGMAANLLEGPELSLAVVLGVALLATRPTAPRWAAVALAALAGFQLVVEINVGLVTTGAAVFALVARREIKPVAASTAAFFVVPLVALVAAGQDLTNVPSYVIGSLQVMLGYAGGMSSGGGRGLENWFAVADIMLVAGTYLAYLRGRSRAERFLVPLFLAGWLWEAVKEGFVRHDQHDLVFFGLVTLAVCIVRIPGRWRALQAGAIITTATTLVVANAGIVPAVYKPASDASSLVSEVLDLSIGSRWARTQKIARYQIGVLGGHLSPGLLKALSGKTMAAEPWEDSFAFEYPTLRWDPEPVLQAYSAYTSYLDEADAKFLNSAAAPQRILYQAGSLDYQDPYWMPPAATVALVCNYAEIGDDDGWVVLAKSRKRCGAPRLVGSKTAAEGSMITVPRAPTGDLLVATFSTRVAFVSQITGLALKPPQTWATMRSSVGGHNTKVRFISATAGDFHLVSVPSTGAPWAAGAGISTLSLDVSGPQIIRFYGIPVHRP
ncbi:MAG TPA: hypothetical protein VFN61_03085 [Acidimicrobiales bacterium]|nr:hypothetical protein [Acidimicrobiales bacterium]